MDAIKKKLLDSFKIFLETNHSFWRISRISTFVDLIIVEINIYGINPSEIYIENISNLILAAKINFELGVKPIPKDYDASNLEDETELFKFASQILDHTFSKINKEILDNELNIYQEIRYLKTSIDLSEESSEFEFIDEFYLRLIARYIKNYFS